MPKRSTKTKPAQTAPQKSGGAGVAGKQPLALLRPDPKNARKISKQALAGLGASMDEFGDLSGLVWNEKLGDLIAGHQRLKKLRAAGARSWERTGPDAGVVVDPKTKERFPVRIVQWDETKHRLAQIAANNPAIQGDFTEETLEQLRELETDARYHELRLQELAEVLEEEMGSQGDADLDGSGSDPDDVPEPPAKPVTKRGDMWLMGDHRLVCGDCTSAADLALLMRDERADLGLHDPPYGIGIQHRDGTVGSGKLSKVNRYPMIAGDEKPFDPAHLLSTGNVVVLWGANHFADKLPASAAWIAWDKRGDMPSNDFSDGELAWVSKGGSVRMFRFLFSGLIREGKKEDGARRVHPTQKPIALYRWIIEEQTKRGAIVYDAYAGSGPTVLACEKLGRRARAMELAPAYCDVIVARREALTGKKAHRADAPPGPPRKKPTKAPPAPEVTNG